MDDHKKQKRKNLLLKLKIALMQVLISMGNNDELVMPSKSALDKVLELFNKIKGDENND